MPTIKSDSDKALDEFKSAYGDRAEATSAISVYKPKGRAFTKGIRGQSRKQRAASKVKV